MQQPKILVAIRKRPLSKKQQAKGDTDIISIKNRETVIVSEYKQKVDLTKYLQETIFNFDYSFDDQSNNQEIYETAVRPLIDSAFQGAKVTCFAYGQTGSGKTFTMNGNQSNGIVGLYTLGAYDIFSYLQESKFNYLKAKLTFFQIYCGKLFDLLNKRQQLKIRQDNKSNIHIVGIEQIQISSAEQFMQLLSYGSNQRITSQNSANSQSSRSHAILQITLKDSKKVYGKISFIDLAGNERGADHMDMNKQTRIDGAEINKSLLSLKQCIRALDQGKGHTPFRGSKLTMVLKDSFIGFCRTLMIGNISPSSASSQNTLNTLRYADRVKQLRKPGNDIQNKQDLKAKEMMLPRQNKNAIKIAISQQDDLEDIEKKRIEAQKTFGIKQESNKVNLPPQLYKIESQAEKVEKISPQKNRMQSSIKPVTAKSIADKPNIKIANNSNKTPLNSNLKNQPSLIDKKPYSAKVIQNYPLYRTNSRTNVNNLQSMSNNSYVFNDNSQISEIDLKKKYPPKANSKTNINNVRSPNNDNFNKVVQFGNYNQVKIKNQVFPISMTNSRTLSTLQQSSVILNNNYSNYQTQWDQIDKLYSHHDPLAIQQIHTELTNSLFTQQEQLKKSHSDSLREQINIIKQQMKLINQMEEDRSCLATRQYVNFMKQKINQKIHQLEGLRQMLVAVRYKLDEVQEVQKMYKGGDDEQLLDDC